MAMSSSNDLNTYGSDDAFDTYIDMDFLRNDSMEEDVDFGNMSSSDLFRYYLEEELIKDTEVDQPPPPTTYPTSMQTVTSDFLLTSPVPVTEDLKLTPVIEETSEMAQQAINPTAVGLLNAQLAELLAKLPTIKQEPTDKIDKIDKIDLSTGPTSPKANVKSTTNSVNNNTARKNDSNQIDMKKLSSKERRQIRNKISARNFRVRRKEYIQNLESTKEQQQEEINILKQALSHLQEENTKLQQEVEELRKQKQQDTKPIVASPPSPPHSSATSRDNNDIISSLSKDANNNNGNISRSNVNQIKGPQSHQPSSPASHYLIPNVNKDASPSSSSANQQTWQDSRVRVQTTFIPEFNLDKHLFEEKSTFSYFDLQNNYPYRYPSMVDLIEFSQSMDGQKFWFAYMLISTATQQMINLFIEAVCSTPKNQMISALFPKVKTFPLEHANDFYLQPVDEKEKESESSLQYLEVEQLNSKIEVQETSLLDSNTMVESVKEASVLDWLYDAMAKHVVEQSQMEAKMAELSDWVGEELDDNVLPFLF